jgi:Asp-tRNA(Asn)/Glu-tRNA(Gln) amidotransferase C subunit
MAVITAHDVEKIAKISCIRLVADEIVPLTQELEQVLAYATCVQDVAGHVPAAVQRTNVFRDDVVLSHNAAPLLAQAPVLEGNLFVVPLIVGSST